MRLPPRTRWRAVAPLLALALLVGAGAATAATPNDPGWAQQWAPAKIGAVAAWETSRGAGLTIGIVDTGVDLTHEDLAGKVDASTTCQATDGDPARCTGTAQEPDTDAQRGHGTHVAGIAAAVTGNGKGIAGVAPDARLVVARAVFSQPSGPPRATIGDLNAGIRWVVDRGAKVVNLSLGGNLILAATPGTTIRDGIQYAWGKGAVVVLAAGNAQALGFGSTADYGDLPAIVVAATGPDDEVSPESGPTGTAKWAIAAPGGNSQNDNPRHTDPRQKEVLSAWPANAYALAEGTDVAAPHVAGTVALVLSRPGVTAQRAVDIVLRGANRAVGCGANSSTCAGRLDAAAAVAATRSTGSTTTTTAAQGPTTTSRTSTTLAPGPGPSTTVVLPDPSTTVPEISVPQPTTEPPAPDPGEDGDGDGDGDGTAAPDESGRGGGGIAGPALLGTLALLGSAGWAALVTRREGLPELSVLPFVGGEAAGAGSSAEEAGSPTGDEAR